METNNSPLDNEVSYPRIRWIVRPLTFFGEISVNSHAWPFKDIGGLINEFVDRN